MAMKKFAIRYIKHGTVTDYKCETIIHAVSPKMALKKFYNYREFGNTKTTKQWMEYDRWANGITYSTPEVVELN